MFCIYILVGIVKILFMNIDYEIIGIMLFLLIVYVFDGKVLVSGMLIILIIN